MTVEQPSAGSSSVDRLATRIADELEQRPDVWLVALVGIPGSGKTTLSAEIGRRVHGAVIVPMDGYHLPRSCLSPEELERRGAPHTFDLGALRTDLRRLREGRTGSFPAFDHARKDPQPAAILVPDTATLVIVEGLYLLLTEWALAPLFDLTIHLDCPFEDAMERLVARHVESGLASSRVDALERIAANDVLNARIVLDDGCRQRADLVIG